MGKDLNRNKTNTLEANVDLLAVDVTYQEESIEEARKYLPMLHGKVTDNLAWLIGSYITKDRITSKGVLDNGEVKLVMSNLPDNKDKVVLKVSTHKLLSVAIATFTNINNVGNTVRSVNNAVVYIPLKEYAKMCRYDIESHLEGKTTEAEIKKENKRAESSLKNARKKIDEDLASLYEFSVSWKEKVRGKDGNYIDKRIIDEKGIEDGYIMIKFAESFREYLIQLPVTQYPVALLGLDERNNNAYAIGLKMAEHNNMDNNQIRNTAHLLKVKTLLALTTLPSIENVRKHRWSWESRIKEPFEKSLNALSKCGLFDSEDTDSWYYCHTKGVRLTDKEAVFKSYEEWIETYIYFTLKDAPDHNRRLLAKAEEKAKAEKSNAEKNKNKRAYNNRKAKEAEAEIAKAEARKAEAQARSLEAQAELKRKS